MINITMEKLHLISLISIMLIFITGLFVKNLEMRFAINLDAILVVCALVLSITKKKKEISTDE